MTLRDWLLLILLSFLWGGTFFFVAMALHGNAAADAGVRALRHRGSGACADPALLGFTSPTRAWRWRDFAVMAVLNNIIPFSLIF